MNRLRLAVVHGPNLNLLGTREPHVYGTMTLADLDQSLVLLADELGVAVTSFQSNLEGALVSHIQQVGETADGIVINPAAFTHTSVAIRDALLAVGTPFVEVHLTNTDARESFRRHSYLADVAVGRVMGFGSLSYALGMRGLVAHLRS